MSDEQLPRRRNMEDDPMTAAQRSQLKTLCDEAHQSFDATLTQGEAARRIEELQLTTSRSTRAHAPVQDESALQSLGEAVVAPLLGADGEASATRRK